MGRELAWPEFMQARFILLLLLVLLACAGFRCDSGAPETPTAAAKPTPDLRLLILTDPKGFLEPCGCQLRPLGGVEKLSALVQKTRQEKAPVLALAAGDLMF